MRVRLPLSSLFVLPLFVTVGLVGCEDPSALQIAVSDASTNTFEPPVGPDAAVADARSEQTRDASDGDAGAEPKGLTVRMFDRAGRPVHGATIVFHDANGEVIDTALTDVTGQAYRAGVGPKMVTAVAGLDGLQDTHFHTWTAIEDGDVLTMIDDVRGVDRATPTFAVTMPGTFPAGSIYSLFLGDGDCEYPNVNPLEKVTADIWSNCQRAKNAVIAQVQNRAGQPTAFSVMKDVATPTDGAAAEVTLPAWTAATTVSVSTLHVPDVERIDTYYTQFFGPSTLRQQQNSPPAESAAFYEATGAVDAVLAMVAVPDNWGSTRVVGKRIPPSASITLDFASALPVITASTFDPTDAARPKVGWTATSPLTVSDGGAVYFRWGRSNESQGRWTFTVAPNATSVKAPALPGAVAKLLPQPDERVQYPTVAFGESDLLASYMQFRALSTAIFDRDMQIGRLELPSNGSLRITSFYPPN